MSSDRERRQLKLAEEFTLLGLRPVYKLPEDVLGGPFEFIGDIPDAAATVVDLTLGAARNSAEIADRWGTGDNPEFILQMDAVTMVIENQGLVDSGALLADVIQGLVLHVKVNNKDQWWNLSHVVGTFFDGVAIATTENNTTKPLYTRQAVRLELPNPAQINFANDLFEIIPANVNVGAAIPFHLYVDGAIWANEHGTRLPLPFEGKSFDDIRSIRDVRTVAAGRRAATFRRARG